MPLKLPLGSLLLLFYFCSTSSLFSQIQLRHTTGHNDSKLWTGFQYQHDFSKSLELKAQVQTRLGYHLSLLDKNLVEIEFAYQPHQIKYLNLFSLTGGIRFFGANDIRGRVQGHKMGYRWYGLLSFGKKWKHLELGYRMMYQNQQVLASYYGEKRLAEQFLRNRISLGYNFKHWKLDPEIRAELFYPFYQQDSRGFSSFRLGLGTKYKINKHHVLKFRLLYEQSLGLAYLQRDIVVVVLYQYKTKYKKKKK